MYYVLNSTYLKKLKEISEGENIQSDKSEITNKLQINVPTDATNYYLFFLMFPLILHDSGLHWPIIRGVLSGLPYGKATSTDARTANKHDKN
jgi:hypothetical protein